MTVSRSTPTDISLPFRDLIRKTANGEDLTQAESMLAMNAMLTGEAPDTQIAAFLTAMRMKGETVDELTGMARVLKDRVKPVLSNRRPLIDICGASDATMTTFNVAVTAAFVVAGAGIAVAKHGRRSITSRSGSADALEALGARIDALRDCAGRCIDEVGLGFIFASRFRSKAGMVERARRQIGIRTFFNIIGPLINPANPDVLVVGVYEAAKTEILARVLLDIDVRAGCVICNLKDSRGGHKAGATKVSQILDGEIDTYGFNPLVAGFPVIESAGIRGGTPEENAEITRSILGGKPGHGANFVIIYSGFAIYAAEVCKNLNEAFDVARESIDSGKALAKLNEFIEFSQKC